MKVLVIGSGGREHALVRSLVLDPTVTDVWCAPGNGGTGEHATNIDVDASNPAAVAAPDARADPAGALAGLESASIIVLPGGSPSRLLGALQDFAIDALLRRFLDSGGILMGASAGAMVLCERTWLPDRGRIADGLGLVSRALVLPHWSPDGLSRLAAFGGAGAGITVLGLPEQSGVMVENTDSGTTFTAHGARGSTIVEANGPTHAVRVGDCLTLPARIGP